MAAPLRRSTRIDGSAGGEPLSCGNQSTYNRVANAGNLHRLSPFQMPFGILNNLTGKSSLTFSIEKCHFITAIEEAGSSVPIGIAEIHAIELFSSSHRRAVGIRLTGGGQPGRPEVGVCGCFDARSAAGSCQSGGGQQGQQGQKSQHR